MQGSGLPSMLVVQTVGCLQAWLRYHPLGKVCITSMTACLESAWTWPETVLVYGNATGEGVDGAAGLCTRKAHLLCLDGEGQAGRQLETSFAALGQLSSWSGNSRVTESHVPKFRCADTCCPLNQHPSSQKTLFVFAGKLI